MSNAQLPRQSFNVEDDHAAELVETPSRHGARKAPFALVAGQDFVERGGDQRNRTEGQNVGGKAVLSMVRSCFWPRVWPRS